MVVADLDARGRGAGCILRLLLLRRCLLLLLRLLQLSFGFKGKVLLRCFVSEGGGDVVEQQNFGLDAVGDLPGHGGGGMSTPDNLEGRIKLAQRSFVNEDIHVLAQLCHGFGHGLAIAQNGYRPYRVGITHTHLIGMDCNRWIGVAGHGESKLEVAELRAWFDAKRYCLLRVYRTGLRLRFPKDIPKARDVWYVVKFCRLDGNTPDFFTRTVVLDL